MESPIVVMTETSETSETSQGFAMAGLLHSNHTPTPGLLELKKVAQPVKITQRGSNIVITNLYDFIGLQDLLLIYKTEELGEE